MRYVPMVGTTGPRTSHHSLHRGTSLRPLRQIVDL